ncbi:MAG: histidine phosphatase family protein [Anaerolineae bacterium]|jgi:phosphohistidine phosphatase|nr:histidine phosphatase family protein [Anaerolineae bacterium]
MKNLLVMRHAKSSWKDNKLADKDRPLNKRGKKDAPMMGKHIRARELLPQLILCSSAERARATAKAVVDKSEYTGEVRYLDDLYLAELDCILEVLHDLPEDLDRVMVIGHNPGLESLVQILSHQVDSLPTAAIAYLAIPIDSWKDLKEDKDSQLVELWLPKDLRKSDK